MKSETGESTQSINQRADNEALRAAFSALRDGATLLAHPKIRRVAVDGLGDDDPRQGRTFSYTALQELERTGAVRAVGVDRYALGREVPADHGLVLHEDPGHGWLAVPVERYPDALKCSTACGYYKDGIAYLEEDLELSLFLRRHPEIDINRVPTQSYNDEAPLRWFPKIPMTDSARGRRRAAGGMRP